MKTLYQQNFVPWGVSSLSLLLATVVACGKPHLSDGKTEGVENTVLEDKTNQNDSGKEDPGDLEMNDLWREKGKLALKRCVNPIVPTNDADQELDSLNAIYNKLYQSGGIECKKEQHIFEECLEAFDEQQECVSLTDCLQSKADDMEEKSACHTVFDSARKLFVTTKQFAEKGKDAAQGLMDQGKDKVKDVTDHATKEDGTLEKSEDNIEKSADNIKDKVQGTAEQVTGKDGIIERSEDTAKAAVDKAKEKAQDAADWATEKEL